MGTLATRILWALLLVFSACTSNDLVDAPTQVLLRVSCNDEELLSRASSVQISVSSLEERTWQDVPPVSIETRTFTWPLDVPIFPRKGSDESRQFQVIVQAFDNGRLLAETRAVTYFERGKHKRLEVELYLCPDHEPGFVCAETECRGEACEVCSKSGVCEQVGVLTDLPDDRPSAGGDAGDTESEGGMDASLNTDAQVVTDDAAADSALAPSDAGIDAGATDAEMDSAALADASSDASDSGAVGDTGANDAAPDATPEPCNPSSLTRCGQACVNLSSSAMHCGRCNRACRSNQCSAGACASTSVLTHAPASPDAGTSFGAVTIDPPFLYYKDPTFSGIQRITTTNSTPSLVSTSAPDGIVELLVDDGYLYSASAPGTSNTAVHRMPLSQTQFAPIAGTESLYLGEMRTNRDRAFVSSFLSICRILTVPKTGGTLTLLASGPSLSVEFETDDTNVFIRDGVAISRVSATVENSTPVLVAAFENGEVCNDMLLTGDRLVFATSQRVAMVSKAGGPVTTLAASSGALLAADAEYLYFIHGLADNSCTGGTEVQKVPLAGGASTRLAGEPASCRDTRCCGGPLMQDSSALYWVRGDGLAVRRVEK